MLKNTNTIDEIIIITYSSPKLCEVVPSTLDVSASTALLRRPVAAHKVLCTHRNHLTAFGFDSKSENIQQNMYTYINTG